MTSYYMTSGRHTIGGESLQHLARQMRDLCPRARTVDIQRWDSIANGQSELIWSRRASIKASVPAAEK